MREGARNSLNHELEVDELPWCLEVCLEAFFPRPFTILVGQVLQVIHRVAAIHAETSSERAERIRRGAEEGHRGYHVATLLAPDRLRLVHRYVSVPYDVRAAHA